MKRLLLAGLILSGCASLSVLGEYDGQSRSNVEYRDATYRVTEHPTERLLLIQGSTGQAIQSGLLFGAQVVPDSFYGAVAERYLSEKKPGCYVTTVSAIMRLEYEAQYRCES